MDASAAYDVLDFWFGAPGSVLHGKPRAEWFKKSDAFDVQIHERFLPLYERAQRGEINEWHTSPLTLLALIIVLDQFPRNMFRDTPRAFATDAMALDAAQRMTAMGWDVRLNPQQRQFGYLPFEHAEDLDAQRESMRLFATLPGTDLLEWARKHYVIIERFGRFPHRNPVLGRVSTAEEIGFLQQPGSSF